MNYFARGNSIAPPRAFTLVEMLLVVAIITLLISILLPSFERTKEITRRTICANNQHQNFNATASYASSNLSKLPSSAGMAGNWLWDVNSNTMRVLIQHGLMRETFTCPSNPRLAHDDFWFGGPFDQTGYLIGGYMWLIRHPGPGGALAGGPPMLNNKVWKTRIVVRSNATDEITFDPVVLDTASNKWTYFGHRSAGSTSHMDTPTQPAGGNVAFLDGHVKWRPFSEMTFNILMGPHTYW